MHEEEKEWISGKFPIPLSVVRKNLTCKPFAFPKDFRLENYRIFQGQPARLLQDGDIIDCGGREIQVIHTPGHSPGHCCFYEKERGYLYSGDLIYRGCLDAFYPTTSPQLFKQSVEKLLPIPVNKILPAHHDLSVPLDFPKRIASAFALLEGEGNLKQGCGVFDFGDFSIHI